MLTPYHFNGILFTNTKGKKKERKRKLDFLSIPGVPTNRNDVDIDTAASIRLLNSILFKCIKHSSLGNRSQKKVIPLQKYHSRDY